MVAIKRHGHSTRETKTPTYISWQNMIQRCTNPNRGQFKWYGGADPPVCVCDRWRVFENFLEDMGERPEGMTLGRTNDTGDYKPGNVAWVTKDEQIATKRLRSR